MLVDEGHLAFNGKVGEVLIKWIDHFREESTEAVVKIACVGKDESCIPQELARLHKHLGKVALRLFGERLDRIDIRVAGGLAFLYIAIAWFRACGFDSHGEQLVVMGDEVECLGHVLEEGVVVEYKLIGGCDNHHAIDVTTTYTHVGPCHRRSRTTVDRFYHDVLLMQVFKLLAHNWSVLTIGTDDDVILGQYACKAVESLLELCSSYSEEVNELLGHAFATARPQATAFATSKDDTIVLLVEFHNIE